MQFGTYDILDQSATLLEVAAALNAAERKPPFPDQGITYVLISYVMIYVSTDAVCDALARLLTTGGAYCILVSERGEVTHSLGMMERRGMQVKHTIRKGRAHMPSSVCLAPSLKKYSRCATKPHFRLVSASFGGGGLCASSLPPPLCDDEHQGAPAHRPKRWPR